MAVGKTEGGDTSPIHTGPGANPEELNFPDAHAGYRLLDRGEATDSKAPFDPTFEATEGEGSAVQAKATMTLEQYWVNSGSKEKVETTKGGRRQEKGDAWRSNDYGHSVSLVRSWTKWRPDAWRGNIHLLCAHLPWG